MSNKYGEPISRRDFLGKAAWFGAGFFGLGYLGSLKSAEPLQTNVLAYFPLLYQRARDKFDPVQRVGTVIGIRRVPGLTSADIYFQKFDAMSQSSVPLKNVLVVSNRGDSSPEEFFKSAEGQAQMPVSTKKIDPDNRALLKNRYVVLRTTLVDKSDCLFVGKVSPRIRTAEGTEKIPVIYGGPVNQNSETTALVGDIFLHPAEVKFLQGGSLILDHTSLSDLSRKLSTENPQVFAQIAQRADLVFKGHFNRDAIYVLEQYYGMPPNYQDYDPRLDEETRENLVNKLAFYREHIEQNQELQKLVAELSPGVTALDKLFRDKLKSEDFVDNIVPQMGNRLQHFQDFFVFLGNSDSLESPNGSHAGIWVGSPVVPAVLRGPYRDETFLQAKHKEALSVLANSVWEEGPIHSLAQQKSRYSKSANPEKDYQITHITMEIVKAVADRAVGTENQNTMNLSKAIYIFSRLHSGYPNLDVLELATNVTIHGDRDSKLESLFTNIADTNTFPFAKLVMDKASIEMPLLNIADVFAKLGIKK